MFFLLCDGRSALFLGFEVKSGVALLSSRLIFQWMRMLRDAVNLFVPRLRALLIIWDKISSRNIFSAVREKSGSAKAIALGRMLLE